MVKRSEMPDSDSDPDDDISDSELDQGQMPVGLPVPSDEDPVDGYPLTEPAGATEATSFQAQLDLEDQHDEFTAMIDTCRENLDKLHKLHQKSNMDQGGAGPEAVAALAQQLVVAETRNAETEAVAHALHRVLSYVSDKLITPDVVTEAANTCVKLVAVLPQGAKKEKWVGNVTKAVNEHTKARQKIKQWFELEPSLGYNEETVNDIFAPEE